MSHETHQIHLYCIAMALRPQQGVDKTCFVDLVGFVANEKIQAVSFARSRTPPAHQMRQAPSSETMQGPMGLRGVQAAP